MSAIRAIVFDLAGVVLHTIRGSFNSLLAERLGVPEENVAAIINSTVNDQWDMDEIDDDTFYTHLLTELGLPMERKSIVAAFTRDDFYIDQDMLTEIKKLRKTYQTALLTNFPAHVHDYMGTDWVVDGAFDVVIASCDVGLIKPDPMIYQATLERLDCAPREAVFIDDRAVNVAGAQDVGMHGILFKDKQQALDELDHLLAQYAN